MAVEFLILKFATLEYEIKKISSSSFSVCTELMIFQNFKKQINIKVYCKMQIQY